MDENMTLQIVLAIAGSIALLTGLFGGGVKAKEIEVPKIPVWPRILSSLVGMALIGIAIRLPNFTPPAEQAESTPTPVEESVVIQAEVIPPSHPPTDLPMDTPTNTPTDTPTDTPTYTPSPLPTLPPTIITVFADQSWQVSGVYITNEFSIEITYIDGQWNVRPDFELTDPLGSIPGQDLISDPECFFPMLPSVAGDQALVAKIREDGEPFNPFKMSRVGEGMLYLKVNDCDKYLYDNSGSVTVRIQLIR